LAIVAGESSGDQLGAGLIRELRNKHPELQFEGVAGPHLQEAGCQALAQSEELAVMGLTEVLPEVARIWRLRQRLLRHWRQNPPDAFVGIDAPDFNLGLERRLKDQGIPVVHYVSPTVWAWRPQRVHKVNRAAHGLLCLFPFEPACYQDLPIQTAYVGHPFAHAMRDLPSASVLRAEFGLGAHQPVLALAPGSRSGEIARNAPVMFAAAAAWQRQRPELQVLVSAADAGRAKQLQVHAQQWQGQLNCTIDVGRMRELLITADVAWVTSGTATLETLLSHTPMVVLYKAAPSTNFLLRDLGLLRSRYVSMPNILAGKGVVPELLQEQAQPQALLRAGRLLLENAGAREAQLQAFADIEQGLLLDTDRLAASFVEDICGWV
jgi:lipid-A-disaccharide synthase